MHIICPINDFNNDGYGDFAIGPFFDTFAGNLFDSTINIVYGGPKFPELIDLKKLNVTDRFKIIIWDNATVFTRGIVSADLNGD